MLSRFKAWFLDRAGLTEEQIHGLDKPLPKGVGWLNTLGSTVMLIIVVQYLTGIFLAMYYAPVPGGAYLSVQYIMEKVPFGALIRGIHHYGASAAVVLATLHLLRVYFQGAFKAPRELLWLLGVGLFVLILGFGFTGYLLPWDQKAYWATIVGTEIPASVPLVGESSKTLARGGAEVGALTLTRFYAIHVLALPALLFPLMGAHLLLVWRKGATAPGSRVGEPVKVYGSRFVQNQAFKDSVAMGVVFSIVFLLAVFREPGLEFIANPADQNYTPRPDWYFLFLFQFLKDAGAVMPGIPEWIPAVVIPNIVLLVLVFLPWLDRSKERDWRKRPFWSGLAIFTLAGILLLTVRALMDAPVNITPANAALTTRFKGALTPRDREVIARGKALYETEAKPMPCLSCHALGGKGGGSSVPLDGIGTRRTYEWLVGHTRDPQRYVPNSQMPPYPPDQLSDEDLRAITDYMIQPTHAKPIIQYNTP